MLRNREASALKVELEIGCYFVLTILDFLCNFSMEKNLCKQNKSRVSKK
jgi:hypothetical protein